ncbi:MAG TPA: 50S ribosomal protein L16 [Candidatus Gracilibacteria bacterium]
MLQPKKTKFRKSHRLRSQNKGVATRGCSLAFGEMGIKATTDGELSAREIEAARRVLARTVKRGGKIWTRVFPDKILTAKSGEVPMGSGKGAPDKWVAQVKPGKVIFEMSGVEKPLMQKALDLAAYKLSVKCRTIEKEQFHTDNVALAA